MLFYVVYELFCFHVGCGHCKSARPHFEQAAKIVQDEKNKMMAAVDCTVETGWSYKLKFMTNIIWRVPVGKEVQLLTALAPTVMLRFGHTEQQGAGICCGDMSRGKISSCVYV